MIEVVDPDEPTRLVGYGETGRVRLTTLTKEFFMPRFLERDEAEREAPCDQYPWDGVRNVRPFSKFATKVVEGVLTYDEHWNRVADDIPHYVSFPLCSVRRDVD